MACVVACIVVWLYSFRIYRLFLAMFPYFRDCYSFPLVIPRSAYFSCHLCLTFRICHATYCLNQNYDFKNQIGPTDPTIHRSNLVHIFGPDNFWISLKLPESTIELVNQLIWSVLDEPNGSKEFFFFFCHLFQNDVVLSFKPITLPFSLHCCYLLSSNPMSPPARQSHHVDDDAILMVTRYVSLLPLFRFEYNIVTSLTTVSSWRWPILKAK